MSKDQVLKCPKCGESSFRISLWKGTVLYSCNVCTERNSGKYQRPTHFKLEYLINNQNVLE